MGWSNKYKRSIDCNNPKGFSQKAHCAGRKIRKENMKLSELKDTIRDLIRERSVNAISKAQQKNREDIARALELYKKAKGGNKSYNEKNLIKVLKKLGQDKKKLEKEMDDKISSLYKNADYKGPIDELNISKDDMEKLHKDGEVEIDGEKVTFKNEGSINEILFIVDKFDKKKQDYGKVYYQDGGKRPGDGDLKKANKELEKLSKKHKGLTLVSVGRNSKMYDVHNPRESVNEGPSREEFRIAAMAIRKQAKFRNVSPEQAIQDQLNALKLLQRYIKKGDVKKYTGMNLSEAKFEVGKVYDNPYHTAFKSPEQINEEDDHEVGMGLSSLKSSVRSAKVIYDNIKKRNIEELDGWVQEKLTLASDYLKNVADYMEDLDEYDKDGNNN